jgi:hypothetical protein
MSLINFNGLYPFIGEKKKLCPAEENPIKYKVVQI